MNVKELKNILKNVPDDCEVVVKNYHASSEMWNLSQSSTSNVKSWTTQF